MIFLGDGGAGKTSLIKRIISNTFNPNERQTPGIKISNSIISIDKKNINLNIWDFGGQEILHATHQFFLSKRSIYVLILDGRKDEKVEYWLKHIESFGGKSPILVVINKIDENPGFEVNRRFLKSNYNGIQGFHRLSCSQGIGIKDFITGLKDSLSQVEIIETTWPKSWFNIKKRLEEITCDYISYDQFRSLCKSENIVTTSSQELLIEFLHDLGTVLHFSEIELLDTQVLNPHWMTEAVYRIITSDKVADNKGLLKVSWLKTILAPRDERDFNFPANQWSFIIALMLKFQLCFRLDQHKVLIPGLLDVQEPNFTFEYSTALQFQFEYDFLPQSILPQFIVKLHHNIHDRLCWRTGVVLKDKAFKAIAVVKSDSRDRKIRVWVNGDDRKEYFTVILFTFRSIHSSFEKLNVQEYVPMPDNPQVSVSYSHLLFLQSKNIEEYIPDGSQKAYSVSSLLGTIESSTKTKDEILSLLQKIHRHSEDEERFIQKVNNIVQLQPNIFGIGFNISKLIAEVLQLKSKKT